MGTDKRPHPRIVVLGGGFGGQPFRVGATWAILESAVNIMASLVAG
jgi:hypothetical protein